MIRGAAESRARRGMLPADGGGPMLKSPIVMLCLSLLGGCQSDREITQLTKTLPVAAVVGNSHSPIWPS